MSFFYYGGLRFMIPLEELNLKICKYKVNKVQITIPGEKPYELQSVHVAEMVIDKDFDQYEFPFFRLTVGVSNRFYRKMKKNDKISAYVQVKRAYFAIDKTTGLPSDEATDEGNFISDNFTVFMEDTSPHVTTDIEETIEENTPNYDEYISDFNNLTTLEILLYKKSDLNIIKQNPMKVYYKANLIDILAHYLKMCGIRNVLCSPPDNNTNVYEEFIVQPLRADEQILRICTDYGMHKYGTTLFFDFARVYIINKINKCTAWYPNEYKTIYVINPPLVKQTTGFVQGCSYESDRCGYCTMRDVVTDSKSMEREQMFGSKMQILDKKDGTFEEISPENTTVDGGGSSSRYMVSYDGDASTKYAVKQRLEEEALIMKVAIDNADIDMMEPNKEYKLVFLDSNLSKYNGSYRLSRITVSFRKSDKDWFAPTIIAIFLGKKPKN